MVLHVGAFGHHDKNPAFDEPQHEYVDMAVSMTMGPQHSLLQGPLERYPLFGVVWGALYILGITSSLEQSDKDFLMTRPREKHNSLGLGNCLYCLKAVVGHCFLGCWSSSSDRVHGVLGFSDGGI